MTLENKDEWSTDSTKLLARLPEIPHTGGYGRSKEPAIIIPFIKGNEVDPDKFKKAQTQPAEKKEEESPENQG